MRAKHARQIRRGIKWAKRGQWDVEMTRLEDKAFCEYLLRQCKRGVDRLIDSYLSGYER